MKLSNDGFTLVEVIVTVVIIGILSAGAVFGFAHFNELSSDSNLEALATAIDTARYKSMSSSDNTVFLEIENNGSHYVARIYDGTSIVEEYKLGTSRFVMSLVSNETCYMINDSDKLYITFKKSDGSFNTFKLNDIDLVIGSSCSITSSSSKVSLILALETGRVILK